MLRGADAPSFGVALNTKNGEALGKVVFSRNEVYVTVINMGRLSAKVASLNPFEILLDCAEPEGAYNIVAF